MSSLIQQLFLFRKRAAIRRELSPVKFDRRLRGYLRNLFLWQKPQLKKFVLFTFFVTGIEVLTPLLAQRTIANVAYQLNPRLLLVVLIVLALTLGLYLYASFLSIRLRKRIALEVINLVREDWLKFYLTKQPLALSSRDEGNLFVKISYHLSLFQMGISSSLLAFVEWVLLAIGILVVTTLLDTRLLFISLAFIPLNALVFFIAYVLSSYYLAQDQTLYSRILRTITDSFNSFPLTKALHREGHFLTEVRQMVNLDTELRIKREVILRIGTYVIFSMLTLGAAIWYLVNLYTPIFGSWSDISGVARILIYALHLKLIYHSLSAGLYYFPLKLGAFLSVPPAYQKPKKKHIGSQSLVFRSPKTNLGSSTYYKNLAFHFKARGSYLVSAPGVAGVLGRIFGGVASVKHGISWVVVANRKRYLYSRWSTLNKNVYYVNPNLRGSLTFYEFLGTTSLEPLSSYPVFNFLFHSKERFLGQVVDVGAIGTSRLALIQIAYCILHQPSVVVVDAAVVDLQYPDLVEAFVVLKEKLNHQTVIFLTEHSENTHVRKFYDVTYSI